VLRMQKPKDRRGKITLVNASAQFKKGSPKNYIPDENIHKIADAFNAGEDVNCFVKVITKAECAKNDFNLSPSRYVITAESDTIRALPEIVHEVRQLTKDETAINGELEKLLKKLGL